MHPGVKAAWIGGGLALVAAIATPILTIELGNNSRTPRSSSSPSSTPSTTSGLGKQSAVPLKLQKPDQGEKLGRHITVELTGTVPRGEHLWIFVYSSRAYYVQDPPSWQPPYWVSPDVNLGSGNALDINALYTIYAVLANSQANTAIQADLNTTGGNTGTSLIPGRRGIKQVAYVTVKRAH